VVSNSLGHFVVQFPMVVAMGFLLPSPIAKSPFSAIDGMAPLIDVPFLPFS